MATMQTENVSANVNPDAITPRSKKLLISYWLLFITVLACAIVAQFAIPAFESVFQGLGSDLPWLTNAVVEYRVLLFILPMYELTITLVVTIKNHMSNELQKIFSLIFIVDFFTHLTLFGLVIYALYLPMFRMGEVV